MTRSRTSLLRLFALAVGVAALPFATVAQTSAPPIKIGWLVALTGPNSSPGIGFDRGMKYAVEEINQAGGLKGRKLEMVTRDTQGDPTKAVNAALELMNLYNSYRALVRAKVSLFRLGQEQDAVQRAPILR